MIIKLINLALFMFMSKAIALTVIDVNKGVREAMPIAITSLAGSNEEEVELGHEIARIIGADLASTGLFRPIDKAAFIENINLKTSAAPNFTAWRQINANALTTGSIKKIGNNMETTFYLWDPYSQKSLIAKSYEFEQKSFRRAAHKIADQIYQRLTGDMGYFDTRIAYISESGPLLKRLRKLAIMDYDGENHAFLTDGKNMALTPRFSPDGENLLYLSFPKKGEKRPPKVYIKDIHTGKEKELGLFPGMTFAPRFSPDGKKVLMSVAYRGNTDVYEMDLATGAKKRLTNNPAIDVSPCYSPDGSKIIFTSDRGGSEQLYVMNADGSNPHRISFGSGLYSTPVWSWRNDYIAFTKKVRGAGFYIGVMHPDGTGERILTQGFLVEGPEWSPNGRVIIFTRGEPVSNDGFGASRLYSIDLTGFNEREINTPADASGASWSSLIKD